MRLTSGVSGDKNRRHTMAGVAQSVRAPDCGSGAVVQIPSLAPCEKVRQKCLAFCRIRAKFPTIRCLCAIIFRLRALIKCGDRMAKLKVEQAMKRAKAHLRKGEQAEARALYEAVLKDYPKTNASEVLWLNWISR